MKMTHLLGRFGAALAFLSVLLAPLAAAPAAQATPASTDVLFVFDTTGSMGGALTEAKAEIQEAMAQIGASLPDVQFGLAEASDYDEVVNPGPFGYGIGEGHEPWKLLVPIGPSQAPVASALLGLYAEGGGDSPEAYGRALYESDVNPSVGWRPGARGVIVLVADDVPHDNDLNEGIPPELQITGSPFDTGVDPGRDNTVGTGDDLDWQQTVLHQLILDGKPLGMVDYYGGVSGYLPYWERWATSTGGAALDGESGFLGKEIVSLVGAAANAALPSCPPGEVRDASETCVTAPPVPPAPPVPSNHFRYEPRISCASGCHVVLVKIVFDSAGNVVGESIPAEEGKASRVAVGGQGPPLARLASGARKKSGCGKGGGGHTKCKVQPPLRKYRHRVGAGVNTLRLKLTHRGIALLKKHGKLKLRVRFRYTPDGGETATSVHTYVVHAPHRRHGGKKGGKRGGR